MLSLFSLIFSVLVYLTPLSLGAILHSSADLKSYDFIVIGAGPGGSTVSNRLTEDPSISVLLLEAGGANNDSLTIDVPLLCTKLTPNTQWDWNYTTTPQPNLNNRVLPFPRGIGLGGTSAVNCLVYTRGSKQNIDKWAALSKDPSWGWDAMLPYFKKSEKFNLPVDGHNITGQFDPAFHGFKGYIGVSVPGASRAIDGRVIQTTEKLPDEFPFTTDMNTGDQLGVGWVQALIDEGVRSSSASYLAPQVLARENLDILLHTRVARVLPSSNDSFNVVQYLDSADGNLKNVTASKEIILSAGAVGTPNILLHSGIGNATTLNSLGITPLLHLPSVGQNLTDHIGVSSTWLVNSTLTYDIVLRNTTLAETLLQQWKEKKTGINVDTSENHLAFLRLPENSTILQTFGDPAAGNETAHFEFLFQNGLSQVTASGNYLNIPAGNVSPKSSGAITINSTNPFDAPLIDPGLLSAQIDIHILREAIRTAHRFINASTAWSDYILQDLTNATTDDQIDEFIRDNAVSFFHPVATAAMSPFNTTDWGVVNPDLRVKGVKGLRIVDASVAPSLPAAHTSAAVYGIAEHAADIIKSAYGLS
ncbi:alcohol oxidase [Lentinula aciculospora]|uniref:Alcohol oxidase n=1 Tax=Lentinula aciculospora TaxID=153920 RepID=A0A9W9DJN7_9AGAR|nr:alcohol oxidase [Lentinula aciculospora]